MTLFIAHNGFHGRNCMTCRVQCLMDAVEFSGGYAIVSRRVAERLNDACCGIHSCACGEGVAFIEGATNKTDGEGRIPLNKEQLEALRRGDRTVCLNIRGFYPQG